MSPDHLADPVKIAQSLIRCPSVTPNEGGALDYLQKILSGAGFTCQRFCFSEPNTPDVDNLYARIGKGAPHLSFAGHTDVVPPGPLKAWSHPPFGAEISADGWLYGRGAADMKGAIACFLAAALGIIQSPNGVQNGSLSFLITGDEEGVALNGTTKMLTALKEAGETIDACLVGEPSNPKKLGEAIKIGRRGSLNGRLEVTGKQGHVAYPDLAQNPLPGLLRTVDALIETPLDEGSEHFSASHFELTNIQVGNETENLIPATAEAMFNIRFNDHHSAKTLEQRLTRIAEEKLAPTGLTYNLTFRSSGESFLTKPGPLVEALSEAVSEVTGERPELSTSGGTSDARFIKDYCPVVEFGLVNETIHQVDERVKIEDLYTLTKIYERFLNRYFHS